MKTKHINGEIYVKPDTFTWTACIDTLAEQRLTERSEKALELLNTVEDRYNNNTFDADIKSNVRTCLYICH